MSETTITCPPTLDKTTGKLLLSDLIKKNISKGDTVILDFAETNKMDSFGGAWLVKIADHLRAHDAHLHWTGQAGDVSHLLKIIAPGILTPIPSPSRHVGIIEEFGGKAVGYMGELRQFFELCIDALYWTLIAPLEGKGFRWKLFVDECHEMGVRAVRINCLMSFLLGLIVAMLFAVEAETWGIQIWVADLVMTGFARELGCIMTAVIVSARTGAAIAAEIATMKVQEEIDALRGMGLNVTQFLVAPKVLALLLMMPCLVLLAILSGIAGGALWGIFALGFPPSVWFQETVNAVVFEELFQGFFKCLFFAVAIVLIGCHNGLRVEGGSRGVGLMTTRAVVMDIFVIIVLDILFALMFFYVLG